jgi:hypothetical protein
MILIEFWIIWIGLAALSNPRMLTNVFVGDDQASPITWQWWNSWIKVSVGSREMKEMPGFFELI